MKFTIAISALLFATSASAASVAARAGNGFGKGFGGNFGGGNNAAKGAAGNANAGKGGKGGAQTSAAAAATTTAAAASSTTAAASGNANANTGNGGNSGNTGDAQSSLTLLQSVLATGFEQDGQANATAGQVPSLTSNNNFINFCATTNKPITNGKQITTGSCNPAPMGVIAAQTVMPASKFVFPTNGANIAANTAFTIKMNIKNLETGNFVNAQTNYYSAPQQVNGAGQVIGHSHFVVEQLQSMTQTTPLDNTKFAFFQGVNTAADGQGNLNVQVTAGLPAGTYRVASINAAANHQPVLVAVAQHGSLDDMVYFTVGGNGQNALTGGGNNASGNNGAAGNNTGTSATTSAAAAAATTAAANTGKGAQTGKGATQTGKGGAQAAKGKGKRFSGFSPRGMRRL